jgi:hypothetical protein
VLVGVAEVRAEVRGVALSIHIIIVTRPTGHNTLMSSACSWPCPACAAAALRLTPLLARCRCLPAVGDAARCAVHVGSVQLGGPAHHHLGHSARISLISPFEPQTPACSAFITARLPLALLLPGDQ